MTKEVMYLSIWVLFCLSGKFTTQSVINIDDDHLLQFYLCNNHIFEEDTKLMLSTTITHTVHYLGYCEIKCNISLVIESISDDESAVINCTSRTGFFFTALHNLSLVRVDFNNCGAPIKTLSNESLSLINSTSTSSLYFTKYHASMLTIEGTNVYMIQIRIASYYGFGILARNIRSGFIQRINLSKNKVENNVSFQNSSGSGMLLLYTNAEINDHGSVTFTISNSSFTENFEFNKKVGCPAEEYKNLNNLKPVMNGQALTVIYSQHSFSATVILSNCFFEHNSGSPRGLILILFLNSISMSKMIITDGCKFSYLNAPAETCGGSVIYAYYMSIDKTLNNNNTNIKSVPLEISQTIIHIESYVTTNVDHQVFSALLFGFRNIQSLAIIHLKQLTFIKSIDVKGATLLKTVSMTNLEIGETTQREHVQVVLNGIRSFNNHKKIILSTASIGIFVFHQIQSVLINGSHEYPSFFYNHFGSVIKAVNTDVILQGNLYFIENSGLRGAAINIQNGYLFLQEKLTAYFNRNKANLKGGAIYIFNDYISSLQQKCSLQILNYSESKLVFDQNRAGEAGSAIYAANVYNCYVNNKWINASGLVYKHAIKFYSNYGNARNISTLPRKLLLCNKFAEGKFHYPGEHIIFGVRAVDDNNENVYSVIRVYFEFKNTDEGAGSKTFWKISIEDEEKVVFENTNFNCSKLSIKILQNNVTLPPNIENVVTAVTFFTPNGISASMPIVMKSNCPLGFQLNPKKKTCTCSQLYIDVQNIILAGQVFIHDCNIDNRSLPFLSPVSWVGTYNGSFLVSLYCNTKYCERIPDSSSYIIHKNDTFIIQDSNKIRLCKGYRNGILCSQCSTRNGTRLSVVFGSTECMKCSNWWLFTILIYGAAGPLLILLLFKLRLTITLGTINGIITYAQFADGVLLHNLSQNILNSGYLLQLLGRVCHTFLSLLNLNLGFSLCFFDGMNDLWKSGLSLVFPLYLFVIVLVLIVLSHYSTWISKTISNSSVQVLVTVIHVSFSKLLLAVIDIFSSSLVYFDSIHNSFRVWYNDATVIYGSIQHLILMLLTIGFVCILLLPYLTVVTTGIFLMKNKYVRKYLRPFHEAIHGPYKYKKHYWFSLRLVLVIVLVVLYSILGGKNFFIGNVIEIPILLIYIAAQAYARPYRSNSLNILELMIFLNYGFVVSTTWYFYYMNENKKSMIIMVTMVILLLFTFFGILVYHFLMITKRLSWFEMQSNRICSVLQASKKLKEKKTVYYASDDELRESLLTSRNIS